MTLRTPRRRISPQTKRRYRAIKGFFRRALGSTSQPHLQITSSIAVNVTDLKHKIVGLEQQLNEVNKHYRDITSLENSSAEQSQSLIHLELRENKSHEEALPGPETRLNGSEDKLIFKAIHDQCQKVDGKDFVHERNNDGKKVVPGTKMNGLKGAQSKAKKKKSKHEIRANDSTVINLNLHNHKTKSDYKNLGSPYSTSSIHSLARFREKIEINAGYSGHGEENWTKPGKVQDNYHKEIKEHAKKPNIVRYEHYHKELVDKHTRSPKSKRTSKELDEDFIADIIKRQYKPVSMFGRRESDFSQFSAPVCRDRDFSITANNHTKNNLQLCDCCYEGRHKPGPAQYSDNSDIISVCNARPYGVNKKSRIKKHKKYGDAYNDSEIYDLVPVKEKSSPKSRRKFFEDNMPSPAYYKEVPPSPRSQRPRLNLKAQYYTEPEDDDDDIHYERTPRKRISPKSGRRVKEFEDIEGNNYLTEMQKINKHRYAQNTSDQKCHNKEDMRHIGNDGEIPTLSCVQYPVFETEENMAYIESPLNKTQETVSSADKTDKALCEIKDILQSFLQEIKKESSSHSAKSEVIGTCNPSNDVKGMPNSGHTFNKYNQQPILPTAPTFIPGFPNTCCYPIMPVCPMNCMQNSYTMPSASLTCNCGTKSSETNHKSISKTDKANDTMKDDTDELIKQIYEFVTQSPTFHRKQNNSRVENSPRKMNDTNTKILTSRSAGGSTRYCRHDAKVGTGKMNCVSKSCEAIRSKLITDTSSSDTNASYSDTVLDRLSLEATTRSDSESELTTDVSELDKAKRNKFAKVLKSFGLRKKNKKDIIEELSESESTIEDINKLDAPFRQNITNYMMHSQEYYRPPPVSPHYRPENSQSYGPPYNPDDHYHNPRMHQNRPHPTAPPYSHSYDSSYNPTQPQVPLCLKEIEVKSIGCQSERKMSFFRKITKKIQPVEGARGEYIQKNCSTQTAQAKPKLFNWKNPQPNEINSRNNTFAYTYKTQKKLAEGDVNMRNAMLKKLFYKKNPFSPRNLIVRTLLGKDKSSFGDAPAVYRPRMFL